MSAYQMASMHSKHSKQLQLPLGDRWGVPEGTSVADCLNWTWKPQPPPPPTPENQHLQLVVEEKTSNEVYVTPTTIDFHVAPTPAVPAESPIRRAGAPTPKHMAKNPTLSKQASKCNHHSTHDWVMSNRQSVRAQTPTARQAIRTVTPAPTTVTRHYETSGPNPVPTPSFQRNFVKSVSQKKKEKATPPPLTFREYLLETDHPMVTGRAITPVREEKFGSYPHYKPSPHPDDVDYIVKQTRSLKMRPPTPGRPASQNGFNSSLLVPRSEQDDAKEKAMIQAIRKELHSSRAEELDSRASATQHMPVRAVSAAMQPRSLSRSQSQSQSRPRSSSQLELVREKKTVGFMDENDYYRYLTYLEDKYGEDSRPSSHAQHFNSWRGTTSQLMKKKAKTTPQAWRSPGAESPGKVNVEMDCPENADMTISLRVRNTPTATVVY